MYMADNILTREVGIMRPMGEVSQALLAAARELYTPEKAATLSELAAKAGVSGQAARMTVASLARRGKLLIVREREVDTRNRPVAEYAPVAMGVADVSATASEELQRACSLWVRR